MNFTKEIKRELCSTFIKDRCCQRAFLAGIVRGSGVLFQANDNIGIDITLSNEELYIVVSQLINKLYDYSIREISVTEDRLNKKDKFILSITGEQAEIILKDINVFIENNNEYIVNLKMFGDSTEKDCCIKNFIKGLFISTGTCTVPVKNSSEKAGYHLEFVFTHSSPANELCEVLEKYSITAKTIRRKSNYIVYIKSGEEIKNFLALISAKKSFFTLIDLMIDKETKNNCNRQANCDIGNLNRQIDAAQKQIQAINKIKSEKGLEGLKPDLLNTAKARLEFPDETLTELSQRLNVTKSCLNHRLRKIVKIANEK